MENNEYPIVANVNLEDLPSVVTEACNRIPKIGKQVEIAVNKAKIAEKSANEAKQKSAGWSLLGEKKQIAIETLQQAVVDQAECVSSTIEANKEIFDSLQDFSKAINYLFVLSVGNVAASRTVVRQLEMMLSNASKEELSEFARIEMESVIKRLRAREDIQDRINGHDALFQEHKSILDSNKKDLGELDEKVKGAESRIDGHDTLFQEHNERLEAIEKDIADIQKKLNQKSFFDTTLFKIIVSLIAIVALALHLFIV